jgi:hypothetical protein
MGINQTQLTPASRKEIKRFKKETGVTDLAHPPRGSETLTVGQYLDQALERRRRARLKRSR